MGIVTIIQFWSKKFTHRHITKKEKKVQIALGTYLPYIWKERNRLIEEGRKLRAEGWKLRDKGNLLYINAVMEVYGNKAIINWETGEVKHD